jgi:hypothetical protein
MTHRFSPSEIDSLAWAIDADGFDGVPQAVLRSLADQARAAGVNPVVADLIVDTDTATPVRARAFGYVAIRLARPFGPVDAPLIAA